MQEAHGIRAYVLRWCSQHYSGQSETGTIAFSGSKILPLTPVHARYTGTGHADTTKYEWATHQHRDTLSSIVGHPNLLSYLAIADGETQARARFEVIEVSLYVCHFLTLSTCSSLVDCRLERLMIRGIKLLYQ